MKMICLCVILYLRLETLQCMIRDSRVIFPDLRRTDVSTFKGKNNDWKSAMCFFSYTIFVVVALRRDKYSYDTTAIILKLTTSSAPS